MPKSHPWKTYTRWAKEHGESFFKFTMQQGLSLFWAVSGKDITHIDVLGSHILVINTAKAAFELFERRGLLYADKWAILFISCCVAEFSHVYITDRPCTS